MELFGTCFYMWQVYLAVYVVGMFAVGYPMGKYSIMVWRERFFSAMSYRRIIRKFLLFPMNTVKGTVGIEERRNPYFPMMMRTRGIGNALIIENKAILAEYQIIQMFVWPLRLTYLLVMFVLFFVFLVIGLLWSLLEWVFIKLPAKILLKTEIVRN